MLNVHIQGGPMSLKLNFIVVMDMVWAGGYSRWLGDMAIGHLCANGHHITSGLANLSTSLHQSFGK